MYSFEEHRGYGSRRDIKNIEPQAKCFGIYKKYFILPASTLPNCHISQKTIQFAQLLNLVSYLFGLLTQHIYFLLDRSKISNFMD